MTDSPEPTDNDKDSVPVLAGYTVSESVVVPNVERTSDMDAWGLFLASESAADESFDDVDGEGADAVRTFIDETAFNAGDRLLFVQAYGQQTCYQLILDDEPTIKTNGVPLVRAAVDRTAQDDEACGDAITPVNLLVRLSFGVDGPSANIVEVQVAGPTDTTEVLELEAER